MKHEKYLKKIPASLAIPENQQILDRFAPFFLTQISLTLKVMLAGNFLQGGGGGREEFRCLGSPYAKHEQLTCFQMRSLIPDGARTN